HRRKGVWLPVELEWKGRVAVQRSTPLFRCEGNGAARGGIVRHADDIADASFVEAAALLAAQRLADHEALVRVLLREASNARTERKARCILAASAHQACRRRPLARAAGNQIRILRPREFQQLIQ